MITDIGLAARRAPRGTDDASIILVIALGIRRGEQARQARPMIIINVITAIASSSPSDSSASRSSSAE
eukprot:4279721-Prymnesium_polylepis.1